MTSGIGCNGQPLGLRVLVSALVATVGGTGCNSWPQQLNALVIALAWRNIQFNFWA